METLVMILFVGALAKGTTKAVVGGGKRRKKGEPTGIVSAMSRKLGCMIIHKL